MGLTSIQLWGTEGADIDAQVLRKGSGKAHQGGGRGVIGDLEPWVSHTEGIRQSRRSGKQGLKAKPSGRESLVSPHHRLTFLTLWFIILWKVDIPKQMGEIGCTLS